MGRRLSALTAATLLVAAAACNPARADLPTTFTLAIGQTASAGDVRVTFAALVSDSRCPSTAMCIQAGDAVVKLNVRIDERQTDIDLPLRDRLNNPAQLDDIVVELTAVDPYPAGQPIPSADVRAAVTISKRN